MTGLPKEHGGTVMAAGALLAGWGAAGATPLRLLPMSLALVGLFLVREPVGMLLRRGRPLTGRARRDVLGVLGVALLLSALGGSWTLAVLPLPDLLLLAAVGVPLFAVALFARVARLERRAFAEVLGILAIALPAPAAHLAVVGSLGEGALRVYAACLVFYLGSTLHLRVLWRDRKAARAGERAPRDLHGLWSVAALAAGLGLHLAALVGPWTLAGLSTALLRLLLVRGRLLDHPIRVGLLETALTTLFVLGVVLDGVRAG